MVRDRADGGQRHEVAGGHVERAAADLERLAVTGVDEDLVDLVGALEGPRLEDLGDDDPVEALAHPLHRLHGGAEIAQHVPERDRVPRERGEVPQPREQNLQDEPPAAWSGFRRGAWGAEAPPEPPTGEGARSEEHTSELQSLMRISYAVFCLKKK